MPSFSDDPAFVALRRSLNTYYGNDKRTAAIDKLYARFLKPGDLGFDIGWRMNWVTSQPAQASALVPSSRRAVALLGN
jgi:hypothetical protein